MYAIFPSEIEKAMKEVPSDSRQKVVENLISGGVCKKLLSYQQDHVSMDKMRSSCMHLLDSHHEQFREALVNREPKHLEIVMCYEQSTACVGVKRQSFKDSKTTFTKSVIDALLRDNKGNVRIAQPIHSVTRENESQAATTEWQECDECDITTKGRQTLFCPARPLVIIDGCPLWLYGCPEMESYEEFCLRSLSILQEEGKFKKRTCEPHSSLKACSIIRFHGRAVLSPLLSAEQRSEMRDHRQRAVQLEVDRQKQQRSKPLAQVQNLLDQAQVHIVQIEEADKLPVSKSASVTSYTLVTDSPGLPRDSGLELHTNDCPAPPCYEIPTPNGHEAVKGGNAEDEEMSGEEAEEEEDISLDSLLKRSREYVKREQSQQGSKVVHTVSRTPPPEDVSDKENKSCSPMGNNNIEFGFSLQHSPVGPPQNKIQLHTLYDPINQQSGCLSPSLPDHYGHLPSPQSSKGPHQRRRRPRPVSTGNIHISFPIGPADLIPRSPGRSGEGASMSDWGEALTGASKSSDYWGSMGIDSGASISSGNCRSSHCGNSPVKEACSPVSDSVSSAMGHHDHLAAGFRRRCNTLDSQLHIHQTGVEHIDRSQERVPRFLAGVTWSAPNRRTLAAPLNQSFEVENPSPSLPRPHVKDKWFYLCLCTSAEETQRRAQALEDMQRRLEEEHALQMSLLLAEQEKEQQRLSLRKSDNVFCVLGTRGDREKTEGARVLTAEQQRALCRISAITRGFLTRRLLKTEKVKQLRQTIVDTQEFIHSFQIEAPKKKCNYSAQDLSLQERVRAQLRAALYDIHDIFFGMALGDRLALLQQNRELRAERKLRDMVT
ncbi:Centriolar coiled-coil protein of 110 kDa Centrosomal protein of 110 kDa [Channa argus]|uniref:Centriolar coiled-coil protein of 110 kDa Centrosomal protein of 110 kDa n=1 Tax=Channa argus TaxID=215402 RepID=A0A6G1QD56_CHAAH|nr:Centriolar coiled-coil protein of 110 kDa Centrosomal protein of 110 kDa [Channa argus]